MKTRKPVNFIRSAKAPVIRAGVMTANITGSHEQEVGDGRRVLAGVGADAGQAGPVQVADHPADVRAEGQAVAEDHPDDGDDAQAEEALHDGAEDVLGPDHAAVEQRQPGVISMTRAVEISTKAVSPVFILRSFSVLRLSVVGGLTMLRLV